MILSASHLSISRATVSFSFANKIFIGKYNQMIHLIVFWLLYRIWGHGRTCIMSDSFATNLWLSFNPEVIIYIYIYGCF